MKILVGSLLVLSLALNIFLINRLSKQGKELTAAQASASEIDEVRRQNQELPVNQTSAPDSAGASALELARLRNEVGRLRTQAGEAARLRAQAAEGAQLRAWLATATQNLARAESELLTALKLSPSDLQREKDEAQSVRCVNNLKQIGLAARIWLNDNNDVFPPNFISMSNELATPKILHCPADAASIPVAEWSQLNPAEISYRFLNPNGNETDPSKPLTVCPIHGHLGLSDGSVQRKQ